MSLDSIHCGSWRSSWFFSRMRFRRWPGRRTIRHALPSGGRWLDAAGRWRGCVFFALSAFLITTLLAAEYRVNGSIRLGAFYARRSLRIWPLYYVFLIAICFVLPAPRWLPLPPLPPTYRPGFFLFYGNWLCALRGYSHSCADILWSVSVEEQFYVIWPLLLWITAFFTRDVTFRTLFFAIGFIVQCAAGSSA